VQLVVRSLRRTLSTIAESPALEGIAASIRSAGDAHADVLV
jgi:hypothetical protein